jgi:mycothiol synthase
MPFEDDPARPWISGEVRSSRQGQGIGTRLYDTLLAEAKQRGATGVRTTVRENSEVGRAFLARRAFVERRRTWRSRLEVATADTSRLPELTRALTAEGIELTTLAREGANDPVVQHRIHELDAVTGRDVPHTGAYTPLPFEEFQRFFFGDQNALPGAWFLAKQGDRYVGISCAGREPAQPTVLQQFYTATLPEFRRRRVALTLKLALIDYSQRNGFARIETSNDSLNLPMWTLNQRLGFQKLLETIHLENMFEGMPSPMGSPASPP